MAKTRKPKPQNKKRIVLSNKVDWAIIDKKENKAVAVFNPQGSNAALRRVAIKTAIEHKLTYNNLKLIPVELMSEQDRLNTAVAEAPKVIDEKQARKEK